jgi:hypothetical protein
MLKYRIQNTFNEHNRYNLNNNRPLRMSLAARIKNQNYFASLFSASDTWMSEHDEVLSLVWGGSVGAKRVSIQQITLDCMKAS